MPAASSYPLAARTAGDFLLGTNAGGTVKRFAESGLEVLQAARSYFVRTDGSDSNDGLANTAGGAFLTIQKALDTVTTLSIGSFNVTINVADGTYGGDLFVAAPWSGPGEVILTGNTTTPANVILGGSTCVSVYSGGRLNVQGFRFNPSSGGVCLYAGLNGYLRLLGNSTLSGTTPAYHCWAEKYGSINITTNYSITSAATYHYFLSMIGTITCIARTITLSGSQAYTAFVGADRLSAVDANASTYTGGTITGSRYSATANSVIYTGGGGANVFPGNAVGTTATGGQYL